MRMSQSSDTRQFGRKTPNSIVINSNGNVREFKMHGGLFLGVASVFTMLMVGYITATAYLAFKDDLVAASFINQARMKHEYEDRIAALRSKVDRITSRQLLDQQAVEAKVAALMQQQEKLSGRSGALEGLLKRAEDNGLGKNKMPVPERSPQKAELNAIDPVKTGTVDTSAGIKTASAASFLRGSASQIPDSSTFSLETRSDMIETAHVFSNVLDQINEIANAQRAQLLALQSEAHSTTGKLASVFDQLNIPVPSEIAENIGGPYIPDQNVKFDDMTDDLAESLDHLETLKNKAKRLPVGIPIPGANVSSSFGSRVDPFHRSAAFHSGIDFKAATGTAIVAAGAGKVVKAGVNGGYGNLVEIDHGNGITTRYAHMSKILVKVGEKVAAKQIVGRVGSTGRSTGPHLHYEVRRDNEATNPARFLKAGNELRKFF